MSFLCDRCIRSLLTCRIRDEGPPGTCAHFMDQEEKEEELFKRMEQVSGIM